MPDSTVADILGRIGHDEMTEEVRRRLLDIVRRKLGHKIQRVENGHILSLDEVMRSVLDVDEFRFGAKSKSSKKGKEIES